MQRPGPLTHESADPVDRESKRGQRESKDPSVPNLSGKP